MTSAKRLFLSSIFLTGCVLTIGLFGAGIANAAPPTKENEFAPGQIKKMSVESSFPSIGSLQQFVSDGTTPLGEGATTTESAVVFGAIVISSSTNPLSFQVELQPKDQSFGPWENIRSDWNYDVVPDVGIYMTVSTSSLPNGEYHWRARAYHQDSLYSDWQEFGTVGNTDFSVAFRMPGFDILLQQLTGSVRGHTDTSGCTINCSALEIAEQTFIPDVSGYLRSIEFFTENFQTAAPDPTATRCKLTLRQFRLSPPIAESDNEYAGAECVGNLSFSFANSDIFLQKGALYILRFEWIDPNANQLDFLGSPYNVVGGLFSSSPVGLSTIKNAKFIVHGVPRIPVILVPGIMGTRLNRISDGEEVWPNVTKMIDLRTPSDDYLNDLKLSSSGEQIVSMGTNQIIKNVGPINFYGNLLDTFSQNGYVSGTTLFTLPYDWRFDISSSTALLDSIVQQAINNSPNGKIDIVAHSMGGLLVKEYLRQKGDSSFVNKLLFAGVPQLGAPRAFSLLNYGDDLDISWFGLGLNPQKAKDIAQNMPAVYELLPSRKYIEKNGGSYVYDFRSGVSPLNNNLTYDQITRFMKIDGRNPFLLDNANVFHSGLDAVQTDTSTTYNIVGCGQLATIGNFRIYDNGEPDIGFVNGDGTVPLVSTLASSTGASSYYVRNTDHSGLVRDPSPIDLIQNIISDHTDILPFGVSTSSVNCAIPIAPNESTIMFATFSPVELHVYDSFGHHTGPTSTTDIELGIPKSDYYRANGASFAILPRGDNYQVKLNAISGGSFDLKTRIYEGEQISSTVTYLGVPLQSTSTNVELIFSDAQPLNDLFLDNDGDGVMDMSVSSTAVLDAITSLDIIPPTITLPLLSTYTGQGSIITWNYSATDDLSGLAALTATLNGIPVIQNSTSSMDMLGDYTFHIEAVDNAGNPSIQEVKFIVYQPSGGSGGDRHKR